MTPVSYFISLEAKNDKRLLRWPLNKGKFIFIQKSRFGPLRGGNSRLIEVAT